MSEQIKNGDEVFGQMASEMIVPEVTEQDEEFVALSGAEVLRYEDEHGELTEKEKEELAAIDTPENRELLQRVRDKNDTLETFWWDLACDIYHIAKAKAYLLIPGCRNLDHYYEYIKIGSRNGFYLKNTYEYFNVTLRDLFADEPGSIENILDNMKAIGSTKARVIAEQGITDKKTVLELISSVYNEDGSVKKVNQIKSISKTARHMVSAASSENGESTSRESGSASPHADENKNRRFNLSLPNAKMNDLENVLEALRADNDLPPGNSNKDSLFLYDVIRNYGLARKILHDPTWMQYQFAVRHDEAVDIEAALKLAKEIADQHESKKGPISYILSEWYADALAARESKTLEEQLTELSRKHNVSIVALENDAKGNLKFDRDDCMVTVYGDETMKAIGFDA